MERALENNWRCSNCDVVFVGLLLPGVNFSNGNINFGEDVMVQNIDKIDTRETALSIVDD